MSTLDTVALVSGGKDSCYTILKAQSLGYNVIAMAHITPPCEEADSMMYQSVGSAVIPLLAESMGLPLLTRKTAANARVSTLRYQPADGDEVEDLVALLNDVKERFPSVRFVSSGALWSDYQRLRVENAASRTGLLSLAPLWRRDQSELLDEMIDSGVDAILIKVAGVGLNSSHLGKSLSQMRPLLHKLEQLYGSHVCGEGGEYETLVRWMPGFKNRINLGDPIIVQHSDDTVAPVSFLRFENISLHEEPVQTDDIEPVPNHKHPIFQFSPVHYEGSAEKQYNKSEQWSSISNPNGRSVTKIGSYIHLSLFSENDGEDGLTDVCKLLIDYLEEQDLSLRAILTVQLYLQEVSGPAYIKANQVYNKTFGGSTISAPPARACIEVQGGNVGTTMEVLLHLDFDTQRTFSLHVQSLSEWAPPCIGPYSQFIERGDLFFVSGVLPLNPPTASVLDGMPVQQQAKACLHNLEKTLEAGRGEIRKLAIFIFYLTIPSSEDEVMSNLPDLLPTSTSIQICVPARALPKGALVEVKSIGALDGDDISEEKFTVACNDFDYEVKRCGDFTFVILKGRSHASDIGETIEQVTTEVTARRRQDGSSSGMKLLAGQLYCDENYTLEVVEDAECRLNELAVTKFISSWMPHDLAWMGILTFCSALKPL